MPREDDKLSTTALARKLDIPVQQLFAVLKDYGWIQRPSDSWVLTPKGEFEGGTYHSSRRYGSCMAGHARDAPTITSDRIQSAYHRGVYVQLL
jgi:hypothetical protein